MKPYTITIPFTVTFDPAAAELAELARFIVTRLTDEGALDEAVEHAHGVMATAAAVEWARDRLGHPIPSPLELIVTRLTDELDRAAGLEFATELDATTDLAPAPRRVRDNPQA